MKPMTLVGWVGALRRNENPWEGLSKLPAFLAQNHNHPCNDVFSFQRV